jgi:hypothetical protein
LRSSPSRTQDSRNSIVLRIISPTTNLKFQVYHAQSRPTLRCSLANPQKFISCGVRDLRTMLLDSPVACFSHTLASRTSDLRASSQFQSTQNVMKNAQYSCPGSLRMMRAPRALRHERIPRLRYNTAEHSASRSCCLTHCLNNHASRSPSS